MLFNGDMLFCNQMELVFFCLILLLKDFVWYLSSKSGSSSANRWKYECVGKIISKWIADIFIQFSNEFDADGRVQVCTKVCAVKIS